LLHFNLDAFKGCRRIEIIDYIYEYYKDIEILNDILNIIFKTYKNHFYLFDIIIKYPFVSLQLSSMMYGITTCCRENNSWIDVIIRMIMRMPNFKILEWDYYYCVNSFSNEMYDIFEQYLDKNMLFIYTVNPYIYEKSLKNIDFSVEDMHNAFISACTRYYQASHNYDKMIYLLHYELDDKIMKKGLKEFTERNYLDHLIKSISQIEDDNVTFRNNIDKMNLKYKIDDNIINNYILEENTYQDSDEFIFL